MCFHFTFNAQVMNKLYTKQCTKLILKLYSVHGFKHMPLQNCLIHIQYLAASIVCVRVCVCGCGCGWVGRRAGGWARGVCVFVCMHV